MTVLWRLGSATVAEVRDALDEDLAYTTVLSALQTLEGKGYVDHATEGRAYRYFAAVQPERAGTSALARLRDSIFQGSPELLFAHLVSDRHLTRDQLVRMKKLLADRLRDLER